MAEKRFEINEYYIVPVRYYIEAETIDEAIVKAHNGTEAVNLDYQIDAAELYEYSDMLVMNPTNPAPDPWVKAQERAQDQGYYFGPDTDPKELAAKYVELGQEKPGSALERIAEAKLELMIDHNIGYRTLLEASALAEAALSIQSEQSGQAESAESDN